MFNLQNIVYRKLYIYSAKASHQTEQQSMVKNLYFQSKYFYIFVFSCLLILRKSLFSIKIQVLQILINLLEQIFAMSKASKHPNTSSLTFITRLLSLKPEKIDEKQKDRLECNLAGKITKMKLIAINNRSVSIYSKIRRAEQNLSAYAYKKQQSKKLKTVVYSHLIEPNQQNQRLIQHLKTEPSDSKDSSKLPPSKLYYQLHLSKIIGRRNSQNKIDIKVQKSSKLNKSIININSFQKVARSESKMKQKAVIERQRMLFENEYKQNILKVCFVTIKIKQAAEFQQKLRRLKQRSFQRKFKFDRGIQSSFRKGLQY